MSGTSPLENIKHLGRYIFVRRVVTLLCVLASALLQTYVIQAFVNPAFRRLHRHRAAYRPRHVAGRR